MSSMRLSFCVKAATSLDADDLNTLTDGIEAYVKSGVDERQAETMALDDLQASVKQEREAVMALVRAQHPDLFQTAAPAPRPPKEAKAPAQKADAEPAPLLEQVHAAMAADTEVQAWLANPSNDDRNVAELLLDMAKSHTARLLGDDFEAANELFARWATPKIAGPDLVQEMRLRTGLLTRTIPVQESSNDPSPSADQAPLDNPLDAGPAADGVRATEPVRGARPPRARPGRADGGSVRGQGGLFEGVDDGSEDLGDRGGNEAVSDRPDDGVVGSGRRVSGRDFRPAVGGLKREGSWHATAKRNLDLIDLARTIEAEGRPATPEEQEQLSKYVGFGASEIRNAMFPVPQPYQKYLLKAGARIHPEIVEGRWKELAERAAALPDDWQRTILASTQYAHYTSEGIIRSVWSAVQRLGFTGGKIFEPGNGIGSFAMLMPDTVRKGSTFTGIEFDGPTALIARLLSPEQRMLHDDFIKRQLPDDFFDVAVGNPPFSQTPILADPRYAKSKFMMHDYFFAKSIDKVRPGGLLAFVTSKGTMDKQTDKARKYLSDRADFMGAVRLPSTAFEANAGTSVVTDVIFLRKRMPGEAPGGLPWNQVKTVDTPDGPVVINEYFADNPAMVLGQNRISGNTDDQGRRINSNGMGGERYTVVSYDSTPEELDAKFAQAIERLPQNVYSTMSADSATVKREVARMDFDPAIKREGVVYVGKNGDLLRVEQGVGKALTEVVKLSDKDQAWLKSYVGLRDLIQSARHAQVTDGDWQTELKKLNKAYDAFLKAHGPVNAFRVQKRKSTDEDGNAIEVESRIFTNRRLYREDYDAAIVTQLEVIDEDGNVKKGPFLNGRTIGKPLTRKVETIGDALAVSLDETGRLDLMDVARRLKITRAEAIDALGDQIYKTPQGEWQLADEFLSGNVVDKLEESIEAARADATLERNIKALEAVQPEKLGPSQISVKLGAAWVDAKHVNAFAKEIEAGAVTFDIKTETWQVEGGNMRSQRSAGAEFGTAARSPSELLEAVLNSRSIKIMTRADKKDVVDQEATTAANEMAKKIKDKFKSWVWTDSERAADLVEAYNKRFNNLAPRRFDGSHLTLPGVSLRYKLHPHQLRAIWRQIQTGDTYLAHAVGAGKTIEMIAGGMEQKRLGLIRKPIYVVPNHMLEQFSNEFLELYPLANIMVADDQNFSKDRRKAFVAAATLNAPDAIVITHDAFRRIGVKKESVDPIRDEILADLEDELADAAKDAGARVRRGQLEQQIEAVNQRFDRILNAGKKDGIIDFEDMGVDYVYVDEAHTYRKLDFHTSQSIKGIDPNGSLRAMDMYVKTRFLQKQRPGRAMTFASGTPVTNTMGELYTIMRFFDPKTLDEGGLATFDSWARMFGEVGAALEPNAAGKYEIVERFSKFDNVPELMSRIRRFMDVLQSEQLGAIVKRPETEGGKPKLTIVESTQAMRDYQANVLQPRLEKSRKWKPSKDQPNNPDPVIAIISDGRIAAADPRFIPGGRVLPGETTKLDTAADDIIEEYKATKKNVYLERDGKTPMAVKGGTQIVFYNVGFGEGVSARRGFSPRAALNKRLVDGGIKREEIAWFDDADTDAKKETIFKGMRAGTLKVLIGSAKKMGTGVNVQNRLTALHYMDPPWYPADVEQPTGRIIRQGNQNAVVRQRWYATKGGYDSTMWQMVGRKQRFIDQAFSGDKNLRSMDDLGEASMYEQAAALASGDPRALQLAGLKQDVERLERQQAAHANEQIAARNSLRWTMHEQESMASQARTLESGIKAIGGRYLTFKGGKVGRSEYTKHGEFGQALKDAFNAGAADAVLDPGTVVRELGTIGDGIKITMHADFGWVKEGSGDDAKMVKAPNGRHEFVVSAGNYHESITTLPGMGADVDAVGLTTKIIHALNAIDGKLSSVRRRADELVIDETRLRKKVGAPFEYQQEMLEKHGELKELEEVLRQEGLATNEKAAPAPDAEQDGQSEAFDLDSGRGFPTIDGSLLDRNADGTQAAARSDREAAEQLQTLLNRRYPGAVFDAVAGAAGPGGERGSRERATVATIARRLFGHRVVFVRFGANTKLRFNGVVSDKIESTIFLNVEATEPLMSVLGHELVHRMRNTQPAVYEEFVKRLEPLLKNESRFTDKLKAQYAKQGLNTDKVRIDEELRADIVGDYFGDQEFWRAMAGEKPILFRRVVNAVLKFLDDIRAFLTATRPFGTQEYLKDIEAARKVVAASMGEFSQAQARDGGSEADGISLSLASQGKYDSTINATGQAQRRPIEQMVRNTLSDLMADAGDKVSWWNKSVGTQYAKAEKLPAFKRVFQRVQQYLEDTSSLANEAANEAKGILPKLETWKDLKDFGIKPEDAEAIAAPIFNGTLNDKKVYDADELRTRFKLTKAQIGLYQQFLRSVNTSLDQTLAADVLRLLPDVPPQLRELAITNRPALLSAVEAYLNDRGAQGDDDAGGLLMLIREKYKQIEKLKGQGYAPLMRFGRYKVHIVDADGGTLYFGLYETKTAANRAARELGEDPAFKGARFERGVLSEEQYKLFSGFPLDSLEMFAKAVEADKAELYQEFLKITKNNRSALKRLIHRKGTAGFTEDVPRVLAAFVTSNARLAAGGMNLNGAKKAALDIRDGDVQDEAIKLIDAAENPGETAGMFRGLMFMNFIGGSIASAVVNLTQPLTMTLPYLSQWGGAKKAAARLMTAGKMAASGKVDDPELRAALERAEADGIVSPQEIHHLTAQASGTWGTNPYLQRAAFIWSAPFSLAEQFNRRSSFIAAYRTAKEEGVANPFAFAEKAVIETQGLYNKGNAPNWGRNPIGASVLTFKQFSVHYLEWMGRMWNAGAPGSTERRNGRMAVGLALAMLMLAAGTDGLPFADDLDDLIDTIGQALGYDMNSKRARRGFMVKTLGMSDEAADVVARGFSALPGIPMDVSLRMSMGNLVPGTAMLLRSNTDRSKDVLELAGPAGGLAKQYIDAATKGLAGDISGGVMGATPVAIQNVGKAIGMWTTGEARDTAGRRVMEADEADGLMRFLGFNPQAIARESEKMGMIRRSEQLAKNVEGAIAAQWARAFADGDSEGVAEARRELAEWNENNPEDRISITSSQIMQRVKKLRQDRAQRFITSTSPERRAAVREAMQP